MSLQSEIAATVDRPAAGPLVDARLRCLALAHAASCVRRIETTEALYRLAAERGADAAALIETAVQVVAYAGFPSAIEGLAALRRSGALGEGPGPIDLGRPLAPEALAATGRATFEAVYADSTEDVLTELDGLVPGFAGLVLGQAYGRILSRPGLTLGERELLAVAGLAVMALPRPLESHIRGALRNGCEATDVEDILLSSIPLADERSRTAIDQAVLRLSRRVTRP